MWEEVCEGHSQQADLLGEAWVYLEKGVSILPAGAGWGPENAQLALSRSLGDSPINSLETSILYH